MQNQRKIKIDSKQLKISCIVPAHNEAAGINYFLTNLQQQLQALSNNYEVIIVDDGSTDDLLTAVTPFTTSDKVKIISLSRNFGKETALAAGLDHCSGDVAILIDADSQHPTEVIAEFLQHWALGYDMVYGVRQNRDSESKIKRWFTHHFYRIMQMITKINIVANAGDFRLLDKKVVTSLNECKENDLEFKQSLQQPGLAYQQAK